MITVAGFNTAIDSSVRLQSTLTPGAVQRAESARGVPGGKGVHVAQMVAELGEEVRPVGLTDALHGGWIGVVWRRPSIYANAWRSVTPSGRQQKCRNPVPN